MTSVALETPSLERAAVRLRYPKEQASVAIVASGAAHR